MTSSPLPTFTGFVIVWAACLWLFLLTYNVLVCRLNRSALKNAIKRLAALIFIVGPPVLLLLARHFPAIGLIFSPHSNTCTSRFAIGMATAVLLFGAANQCLTTWRLLRPRPIPGLRKIRRRTAAFHPRAEDWQGFPTLSASAARRLELSADDPAHEAPPLQRRVRAIRTPSPLLRRVILSKPYQAIDHAYHLQVVHYTLHTPRLPVVFNGLRLVHLSDLHYGALLAEPYFHHAIAEATRLNPDIVVWTGDYTGDDNLYRQAIELLTPLAAPEGVYAVRGNHDHYTEPERIGYWLRRAGIHLLDGRSVDIVREGLKVKILGIEHPFFPEPGCRERVSREMRDADFAIAAVHTPDMGPQLADLGIDIILAGHTHGGQWRLPIVGPPVVPSRHGRLYARGLCPLKGGGVLHVSPGIGVHTVPLRFRCPPEVTLLELRSDCE